MENLPSLKLDMAEENTAYLRHALRDSAARGAWNKLSKKAEHRVQALFRPSNKAGMWANYKWGRRPWSSCSFLANYE